MKTPISFFLPLFLLIFISCSTDEKEIIEGTASITNIAMLTTTTGNNSQDITVTLEMPTPCHFIRRIDKTVTGNIFNYNFIIEYPQGDVFCAQVIVEQNVVVSFDPPSSGDYTINFYVNGNFKETRNVVVEE